MTTQLFTIGKMTVRLQRPPGQIESALSALGIEPALMLNDLVYFSVEDETAVDQELRRRDIDFLQRGGT